MSTNIKITIAESSSIIRCGLETLLKRLPGFRIQISEITAADCLTEGLRIYNAGHPDRKSFHSGKLQPTTSERRMRLPRYEMFCPSI